MRDLRKLADEIERECVQLDVEREKHRTVFAGYIFRSQVCVEMLEKFREEVRRECNVNLRKTHCPKGHSYSGDNLKIYDGARRCKKCVWGKNRERYRTKYSKAARALKSGKR